MKYLMNIETKEIAQFTDAAFEALGSNRKKGFRHTDVVRLKHKQNGHDAVIAKSEWDKFGKPEKDEWDVQDDPEAVAKSVLHTAIEQGSTERVDPNSDESGDGGEGDPDEDDNKEEGNGDPE